MIKKFIVTLYIVLQISIALHIYPVFAAELIKGFWNIEWGNSITEARAKCSKPNIVFDRWGEGTLSFLGHSVKSYGIFFDDKFGFYRAGVSMNGVDYLAAKEIQNIINANYGTHFDTDFDPQKRYFEGLCGSSKIGDVKIDLYWVHEKRWDEYRRISVLSDTYTLSFHIQNLAIAEIIEKKRELKDAIEEQTKQNELKKKYKSDF